MVSPTGSKEAYDMGYTLRTRYPDLYNEGDNFMVWANNYTRVLQTASIFVRGYLGSFASTYGSVVSVTSKGFAGATGNSLSPSDTCPNFVDTSGSTQQAIWQSIYVPPIQKRLQALISGNLTLTTSDITQIPYLCGFESQITGRLSPWCSVFTDDELNSYDVDNSIRYYYGVGPGTDLPSKMMTPFLSTLVGLLAEGNNATGAYANGTAYTLPRLIMSFMNDGQINELITAAGVFDDEPALNYTVRNDNRKYMASHFTTMRGTIAFEKLNCIVEDTGSSTGNGTNTTVSSSSAIYSNSTRSSTFSSGSSTLSTATRSGSNATVTSTGSGSGSGSGSGNGNGNGSGAVSGTSVSEWTTSTIYSTRTYTITSCAATVTNCPAQLGKTTTEVIAVTTTVCPVTAATSTATKTSGSGSGSGSGEKDKVTTVVKTATTTVCPTPTAHLNERRGATKNATYIRIRLNDAVYPVPSCQNGPGSSCLLSDYVDYVAKKYAKQGNWATNCNVTTAGAPSTVQGGSFFTDLSSAWLQILKP
jgi:hypothetical protein